MQINVQGVLVDPTGNPLGNHTIRITDKSSQIDTYEYTDVSGTYNFILNEGSYYLEILFRDTFMVVGDLEVNVGTPTPINLQDLLKYSDPVEVNNITYPPFWENLVNVLEDSPLTQSRESRDQMADTLVHVAELKTTDVGDGGLERKGTYDLDVKSCDAQVTKQTLVYSDDINNYLASDALTVKSKTASQLSTLIVTDEIREALTKTAIDFSSIESEDITSTGSVYDKIATFKSTIRHSSVTHTDDSIVNVEDMTSSLGTSVHTISLDNLKYTNEDVTTVGTNHMRNKYDMLNSQADRIFESYVGTKLTSDSHTNDGVLSKKEIIVDDMVVGRVGNDTFEVDTVNDIVHVRGQFRVSQLQDENGNPIDVSDGDTIFQVFEYSDSATGPWHSTILITDYYRRDNLSVNGVVDSGGWSIGYQFKPLDIPGSPGDTIYVEFQYSPDGVTSWTTTLEAGDAYRRERTVTNGVPGPWSDVGRITGENGDTIEIRSQYSIDGINNWHSTFVSGDIYERRARFVNGLLDSAWSDPFKIVGSDGGEGIPGLNGSGWYVLELRGGVFPSDTLANGDFIAAFGRVPQLDDHLFYVDSFTNTTSSDGKRCITPVGGGTPAWNSPVAYFDGDVIVRGTLSAEHLIANTLTGNEINSQTTILAGSGSTTAGINGYDLGTLPAWLGGGVNIYAGYRLWSGASDPDFAPFRVDSTGKMWATNAVINGHVEADTGYFAGTLKIGGTNLTTINTLNDNTTKAQVGLSNVDNLNATTIRAGTTKTDVGLSNVDNTSDATLLGNAAGAANLADKTDGSIGGWTIDPTYIYSGVKQTINAYSTSGITLYNGGAIRSKNFRIDTDGSAYFKGNLEAAGGTFTGTIYAENIEGDVTDSLVKTTTSVIGSGFLQILSVSVTSMPFNRNFVVDSVIVSLNDGSGGGANGNAGVRLKRNGVVVYTAPLVFGGINFILPRLVASIPANTAYTFIIEIYPSGGGNDIEHDSQPLTISAFKDGSTLS